MTGPGLPGVVRVPELTALFWLTKLLTTGVGETSADWLGHSFDPVLVGAVTAVVFLGSFLLQLMARRPSPWRYWLLVTMVAVFGTMVADGLHQFSGSPFALTTGIFGALLAAVLAGWWRIERTLAVHSVTSARRELLYWATVMVTFALGTAFGDLTATTLGLGYLGSALLFALLIAVPAAGLRLGLPATAAFWAAYILTRPLGASVADGLASPAARGGLGLGTLGVSVVGLVGIALLVGLMQLRRRRRRDEAVVEPSGALA